LKCPTPTQSICLYYDHDNGASKCVEAAISGYFQRVCDELSCATEGTVSAAYSPFLPVASGPIVSCYVEGVLEEVIRSLEHRLLGFQSFNEVQSELSTGREIEGYDSESLRVFLLEEGDRDLWSLVPTGWTLVLAAGGLLA
jgi:hypothetical protein